MATGTSYSVLPTQPPYFVSNGTLVVLPSTSFPSPPAAAPTQTTTGGVVHNTERDDIQHPSGDIYFDIGN